LLLERLRAVPRDHAGREHRNEQRESHARVSVGERRDDPHALFEREAQAAVLLWQPPVHQAGLGEAVVQRQRSLGERVELRFPAQQLAPHEAVDIAEVFGFSHGFPPWLVCAVCVVRVVRTSCVAAAVPGVRPAHSRRTVGCSISAVTGSAAPSSAPTRWASCTAVIERPPSSKKLSSTPTRSRPSAWAQSCATVSSGPGEGSTNAVASEGRGRGPPAPTPG